MKRKRYSEEQIIGILREAESGLSPTEVCRKHGVANATFYAWQTPPQGAVMTRCCSVPVGAVCVERFASDANPAPGCRDDEVLFGAGMRVFC